MAEADTEGHTGGCRCGRVRFHARGAPIWVAHCHCTDCRRQTSAAFATWAGYDAGKVGWTGHAKSYLSSPNVKRSFCSECGTPLTFAGGRWPGEMHILVATFDDAAAFQPRGHVYVSEAMPWVHLNDGLKRFAKTSQDGPPLP